MELGVESLTPIRPIEERLDVWRHLTGRDIDYVDLDLATNYDRLLDCLVDRRPDADRPLRRTAGRPLLHAGQPSQAVHRRQQRQRDPQPSSGGRIRAGIAIVHLGTMGVYGYGWSGSAPIPEGYLSVKVATPTGDLEREILHPANPGSIYHMTKTLDQLMFAFYAKNDGLRITDLHQGIVWGTQTQQTARDERLINRFDYDGDYGTVLNRFLMQAALGHPLTVHGTGGQTRAFIHIRDTVRCIEIALTNPPSAGDRPAVFNQVTETYRVGELAELVPTSLARRSPTCRTPARRRPRTN